ncbi:transglutaminase-like domain-containing protein [Cytobacillus purgationiresistens]|uniref:Transglutaminase-like putative cysteine protease n=1 Tax=Cytobacillus purgationiresistens TaxID=863449 RepID=A0ABU0AJC8_9BACI|nr:transglutaminase family protein [Cytobacillus purgationiresistens]MDQ0271375.1 transglutaminase-like putative cysteine protease [Cytobacillus purgationiresistens]
MKLKLETYHLGDYLQELETVDFTHPIIQALREEIFHDAQSDIEKVKVAYEYVRDHVNHSWDIQSDRIICKASEVLEYKEGICYGKSHLLAALLRSEEIPTGFCYQRLMLFDSPEGGYCIHALNAIFLHSIKKWIRLDARGNKPGVQAEFSIEEEKLAFSVNPDLDEIDYPMVFTKPYGSTLNTLTSHNIALEMYQFGLPEIL